MLGQGRWRSNSLQFAVHIDVELSRRTLLVEHLLKPIGTVTAIDQQQGKSQQRCTNGECATECANQVWNEQQRIHSKVQTHKRSYHEVTIAAATDESDSNPSACPQSTEELNQPQ